MTTNRQPSLPRRCGGEAGFSLIELLVSMMLLALLVAVSVGPWNSYAAGKAHRSSAEILVASLRQAQVSAVAERVVYRVDVAADAVAVHRIEGGVAQLERSFGVQDPKRVSLTVVSPGFVKADGSTSPTSVFFYPRGSASAGSVVVARSDRSKEYVVTVEGLTGRVSYA